MLKSILTSVLDDPKVSLYQYDAIETLRRQKHGEAKLSMVSFDTGFYFCFGKNTKFVTKN